MERAGGGDGTCDSDELHNLELEIGIGDYIDLNCDALGVAQCRWCGSARGHEGVSAEYVNLNSIDGIASEFEETCNDGIMDADVDGIEDVWDSKPETKRKVTDEEVQNFMSLMPGTTMMTKTRPRRRSLVSS